MVFPDIREAFRAFLRWVRAVILRQPVLASEEVVAERLGTCEPCEFLDPDFRQCLSCTCNVDLKANLAFERCPEKKWKR